MIGKGTGTMTGRGGWGILVAAVAMCNSIGCFVLSMQASNMVLEKDLARARSMVKDLLDKHVVVNVESEQKMENLNVSDLLS